MWADYAISPPDCCTKLGRDWLQGLGEDTHVGRGTGVTRISLATFSS